MEGFMLSRGMVASEYKRHPVSAIFPDMAENEFLELVSDIKAKGLFEPIMVFGDEIVDGWHRYLACIQAGVEPIFIALEDGADPVGISESLNRRRRHLTPSMQVTAEIMLSELRHTPGRRKEDEENTSTAAEIAKRAGVSKRTVERAKKGIEAGYGGDMLSGELSARQAARKADEDAGLTYPVERANEIVEVGELRAQRNDLVRKNATLSSQLNNSQSLLFEAETKIKAMELEGMSVGDQGARLTEQNETIRTLESSVNHWMSDCTVEKRARLSAERSLKNARQKIEELEADLKELR